MIGTLWAQSYCPLCTRYAFEYHENICLECHKSISRYIIDTYADHRCPECFAPMLHAGSVCLCESRFPFYQIAYRRGLLRTLLHRYVLSKDTRFSFYVAMLCKPAFDVCLKKYCSITVVPLPSGNKFKDRKEFTALNGLALRSKTDKSVIVANLLCRIRNRRGFSYKLNAKKCVTYAHTCDSSTQCLVLFDATATSYKNITKAVELLQNRFSGTVAAICLAMD